MQSMYYIGLDVHKKSISHCVKDGSGRIHAEGAIPATRSDLDRWMRIGATACKEGRLFRRSQQFAVAERIPTKVFGLFDCVLLEERPERSWRAVVKDNEHLSASRSFKTACSKIQDCCDLFPRQVEPFHNVLDAGSCFEIFEDRSDRHARATEDPSTAHLSGYAFDRGAFGPIEC